MRPNKAGAHHGRRGAPPPGTAYERFVKAKPRNGPDSLRAVLIRSKGSRRTCPAGKGCGLDYCQEYRNIPYIGVLKPEVYAG